MEQSKTMNIRISKDFWAFLKKKSVDRELPMNSIIIECIEKYKNKCEKKLTDLDANV